jgi:hypothetical protein
MREEDSRTYPVREDMRFQRRAWRLERVIWGCLGLILLAALTGLFGEGPLSEVNAASPDGALTVSYDRFQRESRIARFVVRLARSDAVEPGFRLSPGFHENYQVSSLEPKPVRSSAGPDGLDYAFAPPRTGDLTVVIWAHPRRFGPLRLQAQADGGPPVTLPVFIYP